MIIRGCLLHVGFNCFPHARYFAIRFYSAPGTPVGYFRRCHVNHFIKQFWIGERRPLSGQVVALDALHKS